MNKYKKLFSDVGLFTISNFGSKIITFLMVPLYTNILSSYEYGIVDLINSTINLLFPVLTLAISEGILRFAFDRAYKQVQVLITAGYIVLISMIIVFASKPIILYLLEDLQNYWGYFILIYIGVAGNNCLSNYLRGIDRTKVFAIKGILYTFTFVVLNIIFLLFFKLGIKGYLLSFILSETITILYMVIAIKINIEKEDCRLNKYLLADMLKYSLPLIPSIVSWWVMQISDKYIIIFYLGISASGIYGIAYKIPTILSMLTSIFMQAWQISVIKSVDDSDNDVFISQIYKYFTVFSIAACAILILLSKILGKILYANEYFIAWTYVPILLIAYLFSGLSGILASVFSAQKKTNVLFHSTVLGALVNIVLNFLLIPRFGAIAAAYTTLVGFVVTWIIRLKSVKKIINLESNGYKDIIAFLLLFLEAVTMSLDLNLKYLIDVVVLVIGIFIYRGELIFLINKVKNIKKNSRKVKG